MPEHYPIALRLTNEQCLVVGGGQVAYRKVESLLECGARVRVVSPKVAPELAALIAQGRVEHLAREFTEGDLKGVFLVVGATDERELNSKIGAIARRERMLVNIVDQPEDCNFIVPAVYRAGALTLAITTDGKSPALAGRLRRELAERYPAEVYGVLLEWLGEVRSFVLENVQDAGRRRDILIELANSDLPELIESGQRELVLERIAVLLEDVTGWDFLVARLREPQDAGTAVEEF